MEWTRVQKLARVLRVLVNILFVVNVFAVVLVPVGFFYKIDGRGWNGDLLSAWRSFSSLYDHDVGDALKWMTGPIGGTVAVVISAFLDPVIGIPALTLMVSGSCTAVILHQGDLVLTTIVKGEPFTVENGVYLRRAAVSCWVISAAALARLICELILFGFPHALLTYNALFVPVFLIAGLVCMVMSALFRQAAEMKAENDLTI